MELGVRYDEELPDYILVMVVNKKSRQQMHDDLNLFLEDCTTIFVDWLHDQVLKKLQKVTVAKKKSSRDFVPTVVVKQEEEKKKRKISATSFLEDQVAESSEKPLDKNAKNDKQQLMQKPQTSSVPNQNLEQNHSKSAEKIVKIVQSRNKADEAYSESHQDLASTKRPQKSSARDDNTTKETATSEDFDGKIADLHRDQRLSETSDRSLKRTLDASSSHDNSEKRNNDAKRPKPSEEEKEDVIAPSSSDTAFRKLKSCVNRPKITSVVSVKTRLGVTSPRKKFEIYREKEDNSRYRPSEKRFDKPHRYDDGRSRSRNFEMDDRNPRRNRDGDFLRHHETNKVNDVRSRIESSKNERLGKSVESRERTQNVSLKTDIAKKSVFTIKDRLGITGINNKIQKQSVKSQETAEHKHNPKSSEQIGNNSKNIKDRLGPLRNNFKPLHKRPRSGEDESLNFEKEEKEEEGDETELDNDDQTLAGPVKSRIVAVNRPAFSTVGKIDKKRIKVSNKPLFNATQHSGYPGSAKLQLDKNRGESSDVDEDVEDTKLPSKVIVTPRPLKPLQPTQKRATQSLLLRAVAEANQSVVKQKNPEPSLLVRNR